MRITFDIPQMKVGASYRPEVVEINSELQDCVRRLAAGNPKGARPSVKQTDSTQWTFEVPAFRHDSTHVENAEALSALLDCLIAINTSYLTHRAGKIPRLFDSGVIYDRTQVWDSIPALYARRYGDCKSLTAALVAEYRLQGIEAKPVFRWVKRKAENDMIFHILVQTARGFEDPSKVLGMDRHENSYFNKRG
jgi:hypothetical protein